MKFRENFLETHRACLVVEIKGVFQKIKLKTFQINYILPLNNKKNGVLPLNNKNLVLEYYLLTPKY